MASGPQKRMREDGTATPGGNQAAGGSGSGGLSGIDPDQLTDVLLSAGVDLQEETSHLTNSLNNDGTAAGGAPSHPVVDVNNLFLDYTNLSRLVERTAKEQGLRPLLDSENPDVAGLLSAACEEWIAEVLTTTALYSRHRRLSQNDQTSAAGRALRQLVHQDKEAEQRHQQQKISMGIGSSGDSKSKESEETMHRAANDTALMMTASKKRYSWLSGGSAGAAHAAPAPRARESETTRFKEVKEEQAIVLRDLLAALEEKHMGVKKVLVKGYARARD